MCFYVELSIWSDPLWWWKYADWPHVNTHDRKVVWTLCCHYETDIMTKECCVWVAVWTRHQSQSESDQIRSHEITWDQITWDQMRSDEITWDHMRSDQITWDHMRSDRITWDQIRSDHLRSDETLHIQIASSLSDKWENLYNCLSRLEIIFNPIELTLFKWNEI